LNDIRGLQGDGKEHLGRLGSGCTHLSRSQYNTRQEEVRDLQSKNMASRSMPEIDPSSSHPITQRPSPWPRNFWILFTGQLRADLRSKKHLITLIAGYFIIYMLLSFVYFQLPLNLDGVAERGGLLLFLSFNLLIYNSLPKLVRFQLELRKLAHDRRLGLIRSSAYVLSQFLAALPLRLALVTILGTALYYITGLRTDGFQHYIVFMADLWLLLATSIAMGIFVAASIPRIEYSQLIMPFIAIIFFQYGNLTFNPDPTWILRWIQYISPVYYSYQCLIQNELSGADGSYDNVVPSQWLSDHRLDQMPIAACLGALAGFTIFYVAVACIAAMFRYPRED
jgi:ABC-type multidrug transport system permease subunit